MYSILLLFTAVKFPNGVFSDLVTSSPGNLHFSNELKSFLHIAAAKCVFKTTFDSQEEASASLIRTLALHYEIYKQNSGSFVLKTSLYANGCDNCSIIDNDYNLFTWTPRYSSCLVHIYPTETRKTREETVFQSFPVAAKNSENPRFIILWNFAENDVLFWKKLFRESEFYGNFMDYRLFVSPFNLLYQIGLIDFTEASNQRVKYSAQTVKYFRTNSCIDEIYIKTKWFKHNRNHHGIPIPIRCRVKYICDHEFKQVGMRSPKYNIVTQLSQSLNVSLSLTSKKYYELQGFVDFNYFLRPGVTSYLVHQYSHSSRVFMFGYGMRMNFFSFFTIIRKDGLSSKGWWVIFEPFPWSIWYCIAFGFVTTLVLLHRSQSELEKNSICVSESALRVFAPLTDKSAIGNVNYTAKRILLGWAVLCMSLTVLYSGDLVSSMTLPLPPAHPKDIDEFPDHDVRTFTTTGVVLVITGKSRVVPSVKALVEKQIALVKSKQTKEWWQDFKANRITFCNPLSTRYNMSTKETNKIITCIDEPSVQIQYGRPLVVINHNYVTKLIKTVYDSFPQFWTSPVSYLPGVVTLQQ